MTLTEFRTEVLTRVESARDAVRHPEANVHPALFVGSDGGEVAYLPIPPRWFGSRQHKDQLVELIVMTVKRAQPDYVALEQTVMYSKLDVRQLSEHQLRQIAANQVPDGITRPLDDPNAREQLQVVIFSAETTVALNSEITRATGKPPAFGPWEEMDRPSGLLVEPIQTALKR